MTRKRLGEIIAESRSLSGDTIKEALKIQMDKGKRIGETLVDMGIITEGELLDCLSRQLKVPVVPKEKIMKIPIPGSVLEKVPPETAREYMILPLYFDRHTRTLTMVMENPLDLTAIEKVKVFSGSKRVNAILAGKESLAELIRRYYGEEEAGHARPGGKTAPLPDKEIEIIDNGEGGEEISPARGLDLLEREVRKAGIGEIFQRACIPSLRARKVLILDQRAERGNALLTLLEDSGKVVELVTNPADLGEEIEGEIPRLLLLNIDSAPIFSSIINEIRGKDPETEVILLRSPADLLLQEIIPYREMINYYVSTLDFFSGLLLKEDFKLKFHARRVAALARGVARTMGLSTRIAEEAFMAGFFHDFSKILLTFRKDQESKGGERGLELLTDFFETTGSPFRLIPIIKDMDRRFDGIGEDEEAPPLSMAGRVLRAVHSFEERLERGDNEEEATSYLREMSGTLFDPEVVGGIEKVLKQKRLLGDIDRKVRDVNILLVDRDPHFLSGLESRLISAGYRVFIETDGFEALKTLQNTGFDLILCDLTITGMDGLSLLRYVRKREGLQDIPFLIMAERSDPLNINRCLDMGAWDFIVKPVDIPLLLSRIKNIIRNRLARIEEEEGIMAKGDLKEFNLSDLVQVMNLGMKTGKAELKGILRRGTIFFEKGQIIHAETGEKRGAEAFYDLCEWDKGEFSISLTSSLPERNIFESNEFLLLEGMKRLDEKKGGAGMKDEWGG